MLNVLAEAVQYITFVLWETHNCTLFPLLLQQRLTLGEGKKLQPISSSMDKNANKCKDKAFLPKPVSVYQEFSHWQSYCINVFCFCLCFFFIQLFTEIGL